MLAVAVTTENLDFEKPYVSDLVFENWLKLCIIASKKIIQKLFKIILTCLLSYDILPVNQIHKHYLRR